jgi:dTDP-glucose pyrophosphorylase
MGKEELSSKVCISLEKPPAPKRALSAFFLYRQEVYEQVKADNPSAKITEITKIISDMWASADPATKARLHADYERNKEQAAKDKADYEEQFGKI